MILHLAFSRGAFACSCAPGFDIIGLGDPEASIDIPPNGVFRLYEASEGAAEEEDWGVFDPDGDRVPTTVERFDEYGGNALLELRPDELLTDGTYVLRPAAWTEGWRYVVSGEEDLTPPPLSNARFEPGGHMRSTSCGEVKWTNLSVEPPLEDPTLIVRIVDVKTGLFWHQPGFGWNATCGGIPPEAWSGAKEITLVDWAGNESEPAGARVCGCSATSSEAAWPLALLVGAFLVRVRAA